MYLHPTYVVTPQREPFNVLKNGCRVEALQLGHVGKIELALAIYMVVSWRLARLVRLGRTLPELEATCLFTAEERKGAYILAKRPIPNTPPTIRDVIRQIAMLGGFLGRKKRRRRTWRENPLAGLPAR